MLQAARAAASRAPGTPSTNQGQGSGDNDESDPRPDEQILLSVANGQGIGLGTLTLEAKDDSGVKSWLVDNATLPACAERANARLRLEAKAGNWLVLCHIAGTAARATYNGQVTQLPLTPPEGFFFCQGERHVAAFAFHSDGQKQEILLDGFDAIGSCEAYYAGK